MLRIFSLLAVILAFASIAILIAGYITPSSYKETNVVDFSFNPELTWNELIDVKTATLKKKDVQSVDVVDQYGKLIAWKENLKNGGYRIYRMNQRIEKEKLVIELTESSYGLTGTWTFDLEKTVSGTQVTISEESELTNMKIRGYRYFFGRNHDLLVWIKYIRVGLTEKLLTTP